MVVYHGTLMIDIIEFRGNLVAKIYCSTPQDLFLLSQAIISKKYEVNKSTLSKVNAILEALVECRVEGVKGNYRVEVLFK